MGFLRNELAHGVRLATDAQVDGELTSTYAMNANLPTATSALGQSLWGIPILVSTAVDDQGVPLRPSLRFRSPS